MELTLKLNAIRGLNCYAHLPSSPASRPRPPASTVLHLHSTSSYISKTGDTAVNDILLALPVLHTGSRRVHSTPIRDQIQRG